MKAMSCVQGLEHLYDVINVHSYAQTENWHYALREGDEA